MVRVINLNERAIHRVETELLGRPERRIAEGTVAGARVIDCGIACRGGLHVGLELARACLADLADVGLRSGEILGKTIPEVEVTTDQPILACLGSQYAGWAISEGGYFAMGSGPMRACRGAEAIYDAIDAREESARALGILEGRKRPTPEVVAAIARGCRVAPEALTLLIAPTASLAGGVQVTARSIETALHKLFHLGFDLGRIISATGTAPLPPVAADDLQAIGRTNDAILYGARVTLYATGDDDSLSDYGRRLPSSSSPAHGAPFSEIFERAGRDFYAIDPLLFSPAEVVLQNLDTGRAHAFGSIQPDLLARSFFDHGTS